MQKKFNFYFSMEYLTYLVCSVEIQTQQNKMNYFQLSNSEIRFPAAIVYLALIRYHKCIYIKLRDWGFCNQYNSMYLTDLGNLNDINSEIYVYQHIIETLKFTLNSLHMRNILFHILQMIKIRVFRLHLKPRTHQSIFAQTHRKTNANGQKCASGYGQTNRAKYAK